MNLFAKTGLGFVGPAMPERRGAHLGLLVWPLLVCIAIMTNPAAARPPSKKKGGCGSAPPKGSQRTRVIPGVENATTVGDTKTVRTPMSARPDGPLPRWVCPETNIKIEPVWNGDQIECAFMIRNEGKGDLRIKARGG